VDKKAFQTLTFAASFGLFAACSSSNGDGTTPGGPGGSSSSGGSAALTLNSPAGISAYLLGKTITETGADVPPFPFGYSKNLNNGASTQCWNTITIQVLTSGLWDVTSVAGTLNGAAATGATGTCDGTTPSGSPATRSGSVTITNVQGNAACFDVDVSYPGSVGNSGRGSVSTDGKTVELELYYTGQATGIHCADGVVGAAGVTVNGAAVTGDTVQVFRLQ
jgi:hypothetical protein